MRYIYIGLICIFSSLHSRGQIYFPEIKGTTLEGKKLRIPTNNNKYSVIAIAFHRDAEEALKRWLQPLYDSFIKKDGGDPFDLSEFYDVNFTFIPMIEGFKRVAEEFRKNTDAFFWPYVLDTEKADIKSLQNELGIDDPQIPYFFVLDKRGMVVAKVQGNFSEEKLSKLEDAVE